MLIRLPGWPLCAALLAAASLHGEEQNLWPVAVRQTQGDGQTESVQYAGPLVFAEGPMRDVRGFRPFYLYTRTGDLESSSFLFPVFTWKKQGNYSLFSFFKLANKQRQFDSEGREIRNFDIWPLYFSRDTGTPDTSYQAFFPFGGTIKDRLGKHRIHFIAFPLYARVERAGGHTTHAPWPFLRLVDGGGHHGFELWPLFGHRGRKDDYDSQFCLWPLFYKSATNLAAPQPDEKVGALPFYSRDTGPGYIRENYAWPFFGYTRRTEPYRYDEQRYFWPLLVQARGDQRSINRWAPVYTHSVIKGYDKTWLFWPIFRHAVWEEAGVAQEKNQLLFFLYRSHTQRSMTNLAAPPAQKMHLWPLLSSWDNGAGRRQVQLLSPLEVLLPASEPIRQLYSPLFAIYRFDQRAPGDTRHTVLWNLLSWRNAPTEREFHLGPLFSVLATSRQSRVAFGNGLLAWRRDPEQRRWKFSMFDFHPKPVNKPGEASSP